MRSFVRQTLCRLLPFVLLLAASWTAADGVPTVLRPVAGPIGIVVMHGKGSSPTKNVAGLANRLEAKGLLVANLEMPWSGTREYDVDVSRAEAEVEAALARLRAEGARKLFLAGHSQGGVFAMHCAGKLRVDGVIAIAAGGDVGGTFFREKVAGSVAKARDWIAAGKGDEKTRFEDHEGAKGTYSIYTTPAIYLTWFDPEGAMHLPGSVQAANPAVPVLWIVATEDYPLLRRTNLPLFKSLPPHPLTRLYEPRSDHKGAPSASVDEILRWTAEVATVP